MSLSHIDHIVLLFLYFKSILHYFQAKKEARKKELEDFGPQQTKEYPDDILYGIQYQSLFLRIRDKSINNFDNYR